MLSNIGLKSAVEVKDLNWQAGNSKILKEIGLRIKEGTFIGIIGPNGSGKTTLLRNISAWYKPTSGVVMVDGENVLSFTNRQLSRKVAFVAQNTNIDFEFTAMDIVLMGRSPYIKRFANESRDDVDKAREIMKATGIWGLKDRLVTNLSGGELQRVMIARALVQETQILLMDEPISNLDINHQTNIMDLVKDYQKKKNITVVTVLHDLNIAAQYCEELLLMDDGRIFCSGGPKEVLTRENIRSVYGVDVYIMDNPLNGFPFIIPISSVGLK